MPFVSSWMRLLLGEGEDEDEEVMGEDEVAKVLSASSRSISASRSALLRASRLLA